MDPFAPFAFEFMQQAFLIGFCVAVPAALSVICNKYIFELFRKYF